MAALNVRDLGDFIRDQRRAAQISLRQLARQAGVSNPYLSQIERGLRKPSAEILQQIAKALRISAEVLYVQAGILEERDVDDTVMAAIHSDRNLTERQKQVVLDIYQAFQQENIRGAAPAGAPAAAEPEPGKPAEPAEADARDAAPAAPAADPVAAEPEPPGSASGAAAPVPVDSGAPVPEATDSDVAAGTAKTGTAKDGAGTNAAPRVPTRSQRSRTTSTAKESGSTAKAGGTRPGPKAAAGGAGAAAKGSTKRRAAPRPAAQDAGDTSDDAGVSS